MVQKNNNKGKIEPTTLEFSLKTSSYPQKEENESKSYSQLKNDIYYNLAEDNYFYLRNLMHENNRYNNLNYHRLSERLFTSATIILGFLPVVVSFLLEKGINTNQQIIFLTLGIISAVLSIIFGFIDYLIEKHFWETLTTGFKRRVTIFDSVLTKMRSDPENTKKFFNDGILYIEGMDESAVTKSKTWAITVQFSFLIISFLSLIIYYLLIVYTK
jgi:hypothetical protein